MISASGTNIEPSDNDIFINLNTFSYSSRTSDCKLKFMLSQIFIQHNPSKKPTYLTLKNNLRTSNTMRNVNVSGI